MCKTEKEILDFATRLHTESAITGIIRVVRDYFRQMDKVAQLKAENEKLDTENKRLVAELANPVFDSFEELDQLKQTLKEIKEIAEQLYYHAIKDPVKRASAIRKIIEKCEVINEG